MVVTKWGFGMAPQKPHTLYANKCALNQVKQYINKMPVASGIDVCEQLSVVKGLFNRIVRQDQWDWFTTNMYFDYPPTGEASKIAKIINELRKAVKNNLIEEIDSQIQLLRKTNFLTYVDNFLNFDENQINSDEYIYILSRREEKEVLKIGMTSRNIVKRVNEINASTGMLYPLSARKAYRVHDCKRAEKLIHERLAKYRIRIDREFFSLSYQQACIEIERCLIENNLMYYKYK